MKFEGRIFVEKQKAQELENFCNVPPTDCGRGEWLFDQEYVFPNGIRMAIQVIAPEDIGEETAWTQGVLFSPGGNELGCTPVGEEFLGEYIIFHNGNEYVVEIVAGTKVKVRWTATFETIVDVEDPDNKQELADAAVNISLDGIENTEYQSDTWEVEGFYMANDEFNEHEIG